MAFTQAKFETCRITDRVEVIRHTYDCFEVVAHGIYGNIVGHRMYCFGSAANRRQWAIEQAEQWADKFYLYFSGEIIN